MQLLRTRMELSKHVANGRDSTHVQLCVAQEQLFESVDVNKDGRLNVSAFRMHLGVLKTMGTLN